MRLRPGVDRRPYEKLTSHHVRLLKSLEGIFEVELENAGEQLIKLEVQP